MDQVTLLWTLASMVLAGCSLFVQKVVAEEKRSSAFNGLLMYGFSGIAAIVLLAVIRDVPEEWLVPALWGLAAGAIHGLGNFARMESLRNIDSVLFFPLNKILGPLLVVIGAVIFFADSLSNTQYIGIVLSLTVPLLLVSSVEYARQKNLWLGLALMVLCSIGSAISLLFSKQGLLIGGTALLMLCASQISGTIASACILLRQHGMGRAMFSHASGRDVFLGALSAFFGVTSAYAMYQALDTGLVSLVYVVQSHYILIPIVLSVWWYKDHINLRKLCAVVLSFFAIALLAE